MSVTEYGAALGLLDTDSVEEALDLVRANAAITEARLETEGGRWVEGPDVEVADNALGYDGHGYRKVVRWYGRWEKP